MLIAGCLPILLLSSPFSGHAQTVAGIDYSDRSGVDNTFDMTEADVLGQRFPSEHLMLKDEETGVEIVALTTSRVGASKMYQTHPQWTADGRHIVFRADRTGEWLYYAMSMENYEITQVTTAETNGRELHLGWKRNVAYLFRDGQFVELNLGALLEDSEQGAVKEAAEYERVVARLPEGLDPSGGVGLDTNGDRLFFASGLGAGRSAIYDVSFGSGTVTKHAEVPFRANHLQANPWRSGEVMYCWETGGDAPQRIWYLTVNAEGTVENRPLYEETPGEWVTHEVFVAPDYVLFNVMGHLERLQETPTGVFSTNIRTGESKRYAQADGGGYWHTDGTKDLQWAVSDTFNGNIYRISLATGEETLLTTGHRPNSKGPFTDEAHSHASISPDGEWVLFNSSMLTSSDLMLVPLHPEKE